MSTDFISPYIQSAPCPDTIKIASEDTESGFIIINASDFDPKTMKVFVEKKAAPKADAPKAD